MEQHVKFRHEIKYLVSSGELEILRLRLTPLMSLDTHTDAHGTYHIRSIYFDDFEDSCAMGNNAGINPREKWRIRAYNHDTSHISLECKRKENGMILKTACRLSIQQYEQILRGDVLDVSERAPSIMNRFALLQRQRNMKPTVIVGYDRTPYVCRNGNVRITFDTNIFASTEFDRFFQSAIRSRPILQTGLQLLEVKYDEYIPDYIFHAVQMTNMRQSTFSKYYLCRKYAL